MISSFGFHDMLFLVKSILYTIELSLIALIGGTAGGIFVSYLRSKRNTIRYYVSSIYVYTFQGTPVLLQLFIAFFGPGIFGLQYSAWTAASVVLILNTSAFLGEIWRGAIQSVPEGQWDAAASLGLRGPVAVCLVILPQAIKIATPPTVGFLVQLIKSTSIASIIGFIELTRAGQIVNNLTFQPNIVFGTVGIFYFLICWPLSVLGSRLERRFSTKRSR